MMAVEAIVLSIARVGRLLGGPLQPVPQDPDDIRAEACRIVASKSVCDPPQPPNPVTPPSPPGGFSLVGSLLQLLLVVAAAALIYVIIRLVLGLPPLARRPRPESDPLDNLVDDDQLVGTVIIDRSREPADWRAEADRQRAAQHYREALRCRYRALVGDLARRGLLDEIAGRTTGEERQQLAVSAPAMGAEFSAAADLFDDAWFGHIQVGVNDDDYFQTLDHDVLARAEALPHRVPRRYEQELV